MASRLACILAAAGLAASLPSQAAADIVVAVSAPFSGPRQAMGEDVRRGAESALAAINAAGGLFGERVSLVLEDDGCEAAKGTLAARKLAEIKPAVVVGHPCASAAVAASATYAAQKLLFIAPGVRHPELTGKRAGPTIFRLGGRDDRQGDAAARWLASAAPGRRVGLVHDRSLYARTLVASTARALAAFGVPDAPVLALMTGRKDYGDLAGRLGAQRAEAIFFAGYPLEARLLLKAMRAQGLEAKFLGSDSLATPELATASSESQGGAQVLLPYVPKEIAGSSPLAALAAAAIEVWAECVRRTGSLDALRVAPALAAGSVATSALGPVSFDDNGDLRVDSFASAAWTGTSWEIGE